MSTLGGLEFHADKINATQGNTGTISGGLNTEFDLGTQGNLRTDEFFHTDHGMVSVTHPITPLSHQDQIGFGLKTPTGPGVQMEYNHPESRLEVKGGNVGDFGRVDLGGDLKVREVGGLNYRPEPFQVRGGIGGGVNLGLSSVILFI